MNIDKCEEQLLLLLNRPEVQKKIRAVVQEKTATDERKKDFCEAEEDKTQNKKVVEDLLRKMEVCRETISKKEDIINQLQTEITQLQEILQNEQSKQETWNRELTQLSKSNSALERALRETEYRNQQLQSELQDEKNKGEANDCIVEQQNLKLEQYAENFDTLYRVYTSYRKLIASNEKIAEDLQRVLDGRSFATFYCSGCQWNNIEGLWEYLSYKIGIYSDAEFAILTQILDFFFDQYNAVFDNYERIIACPGDVMDENLHTRHKNSKLVGKVGLVYLNGYRNKRIGRVERKSIVSVI